MNSSIFQTQLEGERKTGKIRISNKQIRMHRWFCRVTVPEM